MALDSGPQINPLADAPPGPPRKRAGTGTASGMQQTTHAPAGPGGWRRSRGISEAEAAREAQGESCAARGVARPRRRAAAAALPFESPRASAGGPGPGLSRKAGVAFRILGPCRNRPGQSTALPGTQADAAGNKRALA
jgi:hypothetical protein